MKTTKKEYFATLATIVESADTADKAELLAFIDHEIELLSKKSTSKKPTKTQRENEDIKANLVDTLTSIGEPVTISELQVRAPAFADYKPQKLSPLLHALEKDGIVECGKDSKRRTVFSIKA